MRAPQIFAEAQDLLPGGVNSPVRAFKSVGGNPIVFDRVKGAYAYDVDGNKFIDYVGSWGERRPRPHGRPPGDPPTPGARGRPRPPRPPRPPRRAPLTRPLPVPAPPHPQAPRSAATPTTR